ncbi:hypothetical protein JKP88DRAFT_332187 [Tribonema minus]|uniref:Uncharacterized protein n=1 Tax=Tribonema minus TaxID=303371 RepID=A0A836C9I3_9STRA|nr:hypothetical protein JKP88DRAFT_332187 [Tribonema minus]
MDHNAEILRMHHTKLRERQLAALNVGFEISSTASHDIKPDGAAAACAAECTPVHIRCLTAGTTHRRRLLRGTLVVDPVRIVSWQSVLQDELGDLVPIHLYNFDHRRSELERNSSIAIVEPYFKIMLDGWEGVRVETASEVLSLQRVGAGDDANGWRAEGNQHFAAHQLVEAERCYTQALRVYDCPSSTTTGGAYCSNVAAVHLRCNDNTAAALAAAAAVAAVDSACAVKAYYRCATARRKLQSVDAAIWFCCEAARAAAKSSSSQSSAEAAGLSDVRRLLEELQDEKRSDNTGGNSNATTAALQALVTACSDIDKEGSHTSATAVGSEAGAARSGYAEELKRQGVSAFKAGDLNAALDCFRMALAALVPAVAPLLSNRSAARLANGQRESALRDACAAAAVAAFVTPMAAALNSGEAVASVPARSRGAAAAASVLNSGTAANKLLAKAHYRAAQTLLALGLEPAAVTASSAGRGARYMTERETDAMHRQGHAPWQITAALNEMISMVPADHPGHKAAAKMGVDTKRMAKVPQFHKEVAALGLWPAGCDPAACGDLLTCAYELARASPMHEFAVVMMDDLETLTSSGDMLKRLGGKPKFVLCEALGTCNVVSIAHFCSISKPLVNDSHPVAPTLEAFRWLMDANPGDVWFGGRTPYPPHGLLHSFGNSAHRPERLTLGTTHVSVGFLDLGALSSCLVEPASDSSKTGRPLRWIGYDMSPFAVAKSLVIAEMLLRQAPVESIMQVWYSSAWSRQALASFRSAVTSLVETALDSSNQKQPRHASIAALRNAHVMRFLQHWQTAAVPLADARRQWLQGIKNAWSLVANFKKADDRMALCAYAISGQVLPPCDTGSVCMFATPPGAGERALDDNFLQTIQIQDLYERRLRGDSPDVVAAGAQLISERVGRLRDHIRARRVTIEFRLALVEERNILAEISALDPWTMSWSNCCNYVHPREFHAMARAASSVKGDTIHYTYSMNWVREIKCAMVMDYAGAEPKEMWRERRREIITTSQKAINDLHRGLGWNTLLVAPPVDNAMNVVDYCLSNCLADKWIDAFFAEGHTPGKPDPKVAIAEKSLYNVLGRGYSTINMTFTYDPDIILKPKEATL